MTPTRFDRDTKVCLAAPGVYDANIDRGWWVARGPNGGFVAALLVRALEHAVADPARQLRSLTVHYVRPPVAGANRCGAQHQRADWLWRKAIRIVPGWFKNARRLRFVLARNSLTPRLRRF